MTKLPGNAWGSDVQISMPVPSEHPVRVNMGAMGMTDFGIAHDINLADIESYLPTFAPEGVGRSSG
jgi:hypothetical protein